MSESTPNDTPQPDQHESWDDILSQPIARLANDTTAGEGGWRAVRDISSYSPRRQDVPAQIPSPDSVLKLHLPTQAEGETPQQAKLPDSISRTSSASRGRRANASAPSKSRQMSLRAPCGRRPPQLRRHPSPSRPL